MRRLPLLLPWVVLVSLSAAHAAESYPVTYERNVEVSMRDGIKLRADIYRPQAEGRFPVLLQRTPYDKNNDVSFGLKAASRGYVVIIQDVRGRYQSEGDWYPFKNESRDGYDTVEWAAALPYSDGKVGMFGGSYVGATQMLTAITHPPHLAGICPVVTASNYHEGWTYQGGAFEQWFNESWTSGLAQDTLNRQVMAHSDARAGMWTVPLSLYPLFDLPRPPAEMGSMGWLAPYFLDWLAHPDYDSYWKGLAIDVHFSDIAVPALHVAAWYDIFLGGSLANYIGIKAHGATEEARRAQRLVVVVGGHAGSGRRVGDFDFGEQAEREDEDVLALDWYDHLFKAIENQFSSPKPVKIFVMGANQWREEDDWPLARARTTKYFLHSSGKANSLAGNGALATQSAEKEAADQYVYDPRNPVPTIGGPLCCDGRRWPPGPRDQRAAEQRPDVLIYSTGVFDQDLEVTGPVRLELYASSSAVDTDFTAKLVDVWPDGSAQNLTEGILRASYRESREHRTLLNPGEVYRLQIDLWATSNVFHRGHRLRLEVSSSNFPRFDRNPNTGAALNLRAGDAEPPAEGFRTASNVVYHDRERPSALILPIVGTR